MHLADRKKTTIAPGSEPGDRAALRGKMAHLQGEECMNAAAAAGLIGPSTATLEIIRTLIAFNTVSRESNLGLIEWARDYLVRLGVRPRLTYDAAGKKANLFATLGEG